MAQSISQEAIGATGLPGATAASRHAGATTSGAPTTGTFAVGDFIVDQSGAMWVCTVAGTPGTWQIVGTPPTAQIAGKNAVINGDFNISQRGTTFNSITANTWSLDRWLIGYKDAGITLNVSQQTFTPGTAPVSGYESANYIQLQNTAFGSSTNTYYFATKIEDVRKYAGQTVTLSYWAQVSSGTLTPTRVFLNQQFGTGGSAQVDNIGAASPTYTTSWTRYTQTISVPSISGQTIGTGSYLYILWQITPNANVTLNLWGVQLEAGSTATEFTTASGTVGGELALCQRYYQQPVSTASYQIFGVGTMYSATSLTCLIPLTVQMRIAPSVTFSANSNWNIQQAGGFAVTGLSAFTVTPTGINATVTTSISLLSGGGGILISNGSGAAIYITAEL